MKALFLGKFQPPHIGHVRTILKISREYSKVIIGITKGATKAMEYEEVMSIFNDVFYSNENIKVVLIDGTIEDSTADLNGIDFDVILSGNQKVLSILEAAGHTTCFQPRAEGVAHSSSELRAISVTQHSISTQENNIDLCVTLESTTALKPLEKVMPSHLQNIEQMILADQVMRKPIIIDNKYNIVLDGSHRYAFLVKHGYQYAPVIKVDYTDEAIFVGNHLTHRFLKDERFVISKQEVISRGLNENLFNARTTRHFFPFRKKNHPIPLDKLNKGREQDIAYLIEGITLPEEINEDLAYIDEINEELNILESYIKEQYEVKEYLNEQIAAMKKGHARLKT